MQKKTAHKVLSISLVGLAVTLWLLNAALFDAIVLSASLLVFAGFLLAFKSLTSTVNAAHRAARVDQEHRAEELQNLLSDAALGHQSRMLMHEVGNLLFVIKNLSILQSEAASDERRKYYAGRVNKAVDILFSLTRLTAPNAKSIDEERRDHPLKNFVTDIENLLVKHFQSEQSTKVTSELDSVSGDLHFKERTGSSYLIVHYFMKSAIESLSTRNDVGEVHLGGKLSGDHYAITIRANGTVQSIEHLSQLNEQQDLSHHHPAYDLGISFAIQQIKANGFDVDVESEPTVSTAVSIRIPIHMIDKHSDTEILTA